MKGRVWCCLVRGALVSWYRVVETELLPFVRDCFVHDMFLHFDEKTRTFHNTEGVSVRPEDFGNVTAVSYLATQETGYMVQMIDYFKQKGGYVVGENLFAAPVGP